MNKEPGQLFYIDNYKNKLVIFSAFGTKESIPKGVWQFGETMRKIKYRIIGMCIQRGVKP